MTDNDDFVILPVVGKRICKAELSLDRSGYPTVSILLDDGSKLKISEKGQAGYIAVTVYNNNNALVFRGE